MALDVSLIVRLIDRATGPARRLTNNFAEMRRGWHQAQQAFGRAAEIRNAAEGVSRFARGARAAIAAPINAFEDFQATMSRVRAVSRGITEEEFAALTEQAKQLGATTRFTASQAAEAMTFLGMAGFSAAEQLEAVPHTLSLATAAGTDLGRTSDILSDIMGAFNKNASETGEISDALAVTITGSNTTLETLFETMKLVGPVATDMGISLSDVAAMAGIMGSAGIKGSLAGTAMRASITRLVDPSDKARGMLKKLNVELNDNEGNLRPLTAIIGDVATATEGMGTAARGAVLSEVFGVRALSAVSKLMTAMKGDEIRKFSEQIENSSGAAAEMARITGDNARGATIKLTSAINGMNVAIGEQLEPELTALKETLTGIIAGITAWVKENPRLTKVLGITVGAVALLATALAGLMFFMAGLSSAKGVALLAGGLVKTLIPALLKTILMFKWLAAVLLANPIFWVVAAVVALAAAAVLLFIHWHKVVAWWEGVWERFKEAPLLVKYVLVGLLGPILLLYAPIIGLVWLARKIYDNWGGIGDWFVEMWQDISTGASELWADLRKGWSGAAGFVGGIIDEIMVILDPFLTIASAIGDVLLTPLKGLKFMAEGAVGVLEGGVEVLAGPGAAGGGAATGEQAARLDIKIDAEGRPSITRMQSTGFNMEADTGFNMETE